MKAKTSCIAIGLLMLVGVLIAPTYALINPVPRYVIITTNEIVSNSQQLENFIAMKTHQGFRVTVVTEDDFDSLEGQPPNGRAEKIRQWLINNYEELNIKYVLLIGDPHPDDTLRGDDYPGDIPMKRCWHSYYRGGEREGPADFFYADLNSNWNYDGDDFFCEIFPFEGKQSPDPAIIGEDNFSVKWEGQLMCDSSGTYRISIRSDGGAAVFIDGELLICDECGETPVEHLPLYTDATGDPYLGQGLHNIEIWYRDYTGDAFISLAWTPPGGSFVIIPKDNLYHIGPAGFQPGGLIGVYFGDVSYTDHKFSRIDETVNFTWLRGDMSGFDPNPDPEVYVGRIPVYILKENDDPNVERFTELDSILEKIIDYETDDGDIVWRKSLLLPIGITDGVDIEVRGANKIKDEIADPMTFTSTRIYDYDPPTHYIDDGTPIPMPEIKPLEPLNVVNEWNNGYGMVVWNAHGSPTGASMIIDVDHYLPQLDDTKPSFTFAGSCNTGYPEISNNLAYSLLKSGGGIANVAGARVTSGGFAGYDASLGYPYAENVISYGMPAGMALDEAKADSFYADYPSNVDKNDVLFNLYGEPNIHLLKTFPMQVVENPICGDVNCDGEVNNLDYWYVHPWTALQISKKWAADVNCDGSVTLADAEAIMLYINDEVPLQCCSDPSISIKNKLYGVRSYITDLPDNIFAKNAVEMKRAISNKFYAVHELVDTGYYEGAYMKIENDIRSKMHDVHDNCWITDPGEQEEICGMLDGIKADLAVLMDQPK